jgi:hypothetical protein
MALVSAGEGERAPGRGITAVGGGRDDNAGGVLAGRNPSGRFAMSRTSPGLIE